jgi:hypothetical protein
MSSNVLTSIDPGVHQGWARFSGGMLYACGLGETPFVGDVYIELPQVYARQKKRADPNDLITLAVRIGQLKERAERKSLTVRLIKPAEWKGQTPKEIHNRRVLAAMQPSEVEVFKELKVAQSLKHNVLDAIGIGLWALGRMVR